MFRAATRFARQFRPLPLFRALGVATAVPFASSQTSVDAKKYLEGLMNPIKRDAYPGSVPYIANNALPFTMKCPAGTHPIQVFEMVVKFEDEECYISGEDYTHEFRLVSQRPNILRSFEKCVPKMHENDSIINIPVSPEAEHVAVRFSEPHDFSSVNRLKTMEKQIETVYRDPFSPKLPEFIKVDDTLIFSPFLKKDWKKEEVELYKNNGTWDTKSTTLSFTKTH